MPVRFRPRDPNGNQESCTDGPLGRPIQRRAERRLLNKVRLDPEVYDEREFPVETPLGKWGYQGENLGAVYRYLDSNVGRPWDLVYSEIRARFDIRALNAYHIVMDHMVGMVQTADDPRYRYYRYYVDKQGRLVHNNCWSRCIGRKNNEEVQLRSL